MIDRFPLCPAARRPSRRTAVACLTLLAGAAAACGSPDDGDLRASELPPRAAELAAAAPCAPAGDVAITLPPALCATVFSRDVSGARKVVAREDGTVFVLRRNAPQAEGGIVALRDTNGDGVADARTNFGAGVRGTGLAMQGEQLYADAGGAIVRFRIPRGATTPAGAVDTIVAGLPRGGHDALTFALDGRGGLFVNVGSLTNSCQEKDRQKGSPGVDPCTELDTRAGIWRFDANRTGQRAADGTRWATGIRNATAITFSPSGQLWVAQHGRDQLLQNWGDYYTAQQSAENPGEELLLVNRGDDFGWPYCYYSHDHDRMVLAPEYGGRGQGEVGRCASAKSPVAVFPGHWAPMDLLFYTGRALPARYRDGVFVTFHGSWNRAPLPQGGYNVVFQPLRNGRAAGEYEVVADGFAGQSPLANPGAAAHRPVGLAQGADGAVFVTDDKGGWIWRLTGSAARGD